MNKDEIDTRLAHLDTLGGVLPYFSLSFVSLNEEETQFLQKQVRLVTVNLPTKRVPQPEAAIMIEAVRYMVKSQCGSECEVRVERGTRNAVPELPSGFQHTQVHVVADVQAGDVPPKVKSCLEYWANHGLENVTHQLLLEIRAGGQAA